MILPGQRVGLLGTMALGLSETAVTADTAAAVASNTLTEVLAVLPGQVVGLLGTVAVKTVLDTTSVTADILYQLLPLLLLLLPLLLLLLLSKHTEVGVVLPEQMVALLGTVALKTTFNITSATAYIPYQLLPLSWLLLLLLSKLTEAGGWGGGGWGGVGWCFQSRW